MQTQIISTVLAALASWYIIEQIKEMRDKNGENIRPVSDIASAEIQSETFV
jgi:hypothetical protein